ncbi:hypothetical protein KC332_g953 [Hortaea werneckii]|uniref:SPRY domain-containing protein n=2 Tax=Hortaea werneckii TaxID=91943 RepID=A0A3M7IVT5_HORWE|nr:hypothetical protein KC358_g1069 [Hortaea werneckii]OTA38803.1 hypothetical protein BTJ68_01235 [Hortaea werneckii EXF-2000]KAI6852293.1 hypothetical protein KC350_g1029 [Hortaea werneckii]KAI6944437.1 hypothetical protein KC341_g814 [Hortaea werneckii]KAI6979449.1 hypothetical protein KC321_g2345 [Hortaea werneckii]
MGDEYAPPPGPPPGYRPRQTGSESQAASHHRVQWTGGSSSDPNREQGPNNPYRNAHMNTLQAPPQSDEPPAYQPPPGPPPQWQGDKKQPMPDSDFAPPPGPPPGRSQGEEQFASPPGPPPGRSQGDDQYAPPSGPPPSQRLAEEEPPPYDPWMAVPDSSFLPPPPSMFEERSPTANATYSDAARAHAWCRRNPLWRPQRLPQQTLHRIQTGDIRLTVPPGTNTLHLYQPGPGRTSIRSNSKCADTILLSDIPIYSPSQSLPQKAPHTVYFELKVSSMGAIDPRSGESDAGIAIGLLAPPYPSWRLPGWHRGSLGVHGDDGRRYVDNSYGGRDFTSAFRKGDVVGIGLKIFPLPPHQQGKQSVKRTVEVFFTRNGKLDGTGKGWNLHEERDQEEDTGDVRGLEGNHDILAAVGVFGKVELEVRCRREDWAFKP